MGCGIKTLEDPETLALGSESAGPNLSPGVGRSARRTSESRSLFTHLFTHEAQLPGLGRMQPDSTDSLSAPDSAGQEQSRRSWATISVRAEQTFNPAGRVRDPGGPQRNKVLCDAESDFAGLTGTQLRIFGLTTAPTSTSEARAERVGPQGRARAMIASTTPPLESA